MAPTFSAWLRETARLYLRYMAVALSSIPFALGAAWASKEGWHERVALSLALLCGIATAIALWKWMGDWRLKPEIAATPIEAEWADLMKVAIGSSDVRRVWGTLDENGPRIRREYALFVVGSGAEARMTEISLRTPNQASGDRVVALNYDDALQQVMLGMSQPRHKAEPQESRERANSLQGLLAQTWLGGLQQPLALTDSN